MIPGTASTACQGNKDLEHIDACFTALSHPMRRKAMQVVIQKPNGASIEDITVAIELSENIETESDPTQLLRHRHIPVLENQELITYDEETNTLKADQICVAEELLEGVERAYNKP